MNAPLASTPRPPPIVSIGAGLAAGIPAAILATAAVLAAPHVRGIGFFPVLRFAVVTPGCLVAGIAAAFAYGELRSRSARPARVLAFGLVVVVVALAVAMGIGGPPGLVAAALPALLVVASYFVWRIPRVVDRPRRSRLRLGALSIFGAFEIAGVYFALASERLPPPGPDGLAFAIPREMFDAEQRFVDLPSGARIHYVDEGQGDTLLFLHGNPAWSFQWRDLVRDLRGSYRCIALDYPGFGLSEARPGFGFTPREQSHVVEELVDHLDLEDVTFVMQDWGGPIGLGLAGRRPELVRGFVLGSTWAWPTTTDVPRGKFSVIAGGPIGEFVQVNFNGFASIGIDNGIVRELPADVLDVYKHPFRPLDRRGIAAFYPGQINAATDFFEEVESGLPKLADKPALIFWARRDQGIPREDLARFQAAFPRNETIELPDADHFFFEDVGPQMVNAMRAFLAAEHARRGR